MPWIATLMAFGLLTTACGGDDADDEFAAACYDVASGSSWWSLTESFGLDPNLYWRYVRDLNPGAQSGEDPNLLISGRTVCLTDEQLAAVEPIQDQPVEEIVAENDDTAADRPDDNQSEVPGDQDAADGATDCGHFSCVRYDRAAGTGIAAFTAGIGPSDLAAGPSIAENGAALDLEVDGQAGPTADGNSTLQQPDITGHGETALPGAVDRIVELYRDGRWPELRDEYEAASAGSISEVTRSAIYSLADLNRDRTPSDFVIAHYARQLGLLQADRQESLHPEVLDQVLEDLGTAVGR